jgi:hypothetical protein
MRTRRASGSISAGGHDESPLGGTAGVSTRSQGTIWMRSHASQGEPCSRSQRDTDNKCTTTTITTTTRTHYHTRARAGPAARAHSQLRVGQRLHGRGVNRTEGRKVDHDVHVGVPDNAATRGVATRCQRQAGSYCYATDHNGKRSRSCQKTISRGHSKLPQPGQQSIVSTIRGTGAA